MSQEIEIRSYVLDILAISKVPVRCVMHVSHPLQSHKLGFVRLSHNVHVHVVCNVLHLFKLSIGLLHAFCALILCLTMYSFFIKMVICKYSFISTYFADRGQYEFQLAMHQHIV